MNKSKLKKIYNKIFPSFVFYLEKELKNCNSILDLGCGPNSPIKDLKNKPYSVGVDIFQPSINKSKKKRIHNQYFKMDVLKIDKKFKPKSFDCVIAIDLIEHLTKRTGIILIKKMERIARKKIIIFTPNGFLKQHEYDNNLNQVHISGWSVSEMRKMKFKVIGFNGFKKLRGEKGEIKLKPKLFWLIVSDFSQFFLKNNPEKAFQLLCVKEIK